MYILIVIRLEREREWERERDGVNKQHALLYLAQEA